MPLRYTGRRRRNRATGAPRGRPPAFSGPYKSGFMQLLLTKWKALSSAAKKEKTELLDCAARAFFVRFPLLHSFKDFYVDPPADPGPPTPWDVIIPPIREGEVSEEEIAAHDELIGQIRSKILSWLQNNNKRKREDDDHDNTHITRVLDLMNDSLMQRPRKKRCIDEYLNDKRDELMVLIEDNWAASQGEDVTRIEVQTDTVCTAWKNESPEYKKMIEDKVLTVHKALLDMYKQKGIKVSRTVEDYNIAWDAGPKIVLPIIEALGAYFGLSVHMILMGPDPYNGGRVGVTTMHSDIDRGQAGCCWSQMASFRAVLKSAEEYAFKYWDGKQIPDRVYVGPSAASQAAASEGSLSQSIIAEAAIKTFASQSISSASAQSRREVVEILADEDMPELVDPDEFYADEDEEEDDEEDDEEAIVLDEEAAEAEQEAVDEEVEVEVQTDTLGVSLEDIEADFDAIRAAWPEEMNSSRELLLSGESLGLPVAKLLKALLVFESKRGYITTQYTRSVLQPSEIDKWESDNRPVEGPTLLRAFGTRFSNWWLDTQPDKRRNFTDGTLLRDKAPYQWKECDSYRCGEFGVMLTVLSIIWWGNHIKVTTRDDKDPLREDWDFLVDDITWALTQMSEIATRDAESDDGAVLRELTAATTRLRLSQKESEDLTAASKARRPRVSRAKAVTSKTGKTRAVTSKNSKTKVVTPATGKTKAKAAKSTPASNSASAPAKVPRPKPVPVTRPPSQRIAASKPKA